MSQVVDLPGEDGDIEEEQSEEQRSIDSSA